MEPIKPKVDVVDHLPVLPLSFNPYQVSTPQITTLPSAPSGIHSALDSKVAQLMLAQVSKMQSSFSNGQGTKR